MDLLSRVIESINYSLDLHRVHNSIKIRVYEK